MCQHASHGFGFLNGFAKKAGFALKRYAGIVMPATVAACEYNRFVGKAMSVKIDQDVWALGSQVKGWEKEVCERKQTRSLLANIISHPILATVAWLTRRQNPSCGFCERFSNALLCKDIERSFNAPETSKIMIKRIESLRQIAYDNVPGIERRFVYGLSKPLDVIKADA